MKKLWRFLSSMRFALILLVILAAACAGGSFLTQGQTQAWYAQTYGERAAGLILGLGLDHVFRSWWFLTLGALLCGSLILCNVSRVKQLLRRTQAAAAPEAPAAPTARAEGLTDPAPLFGDLGLPSPKETADAQGRKTLISRKHRAGLWGAWVCHLGILLLLLGYGLGQITQQQYTVYGVPGQTKAIGDTGAVLTIDAFDVDLREDDTVAQYQAHVTLTDGTRTQSAAASVNHPGSAFGFKIYQNSTGWAATVRITEAGAPLQAEVLCAGEALSVADKPQLVLLLNAVYPDYVMTDAGPATASGRRNNPAFLYTLYYQAPGETDPRILGMNVLQAGERITVDDYEFTMEDPRQYTLLQLRRDRFTLLTLLGGLVTLLGLILALYFQPVTLRATKEEDGTWTLTGDCPKAGALFRERFEQAVAAREKEADHAAG